MQVSVHLFFLDEIFIDRIAEITLFFSTIPRSTAIGNSSKRDLLRIQEDGYEGED